MSDYLQGVLQLVYRPLRTKKVHDPKGLSYLPTDYCHEYGSCQRRIYIDNSFFIRDQSKRIYFTPKQSEELRSAILKDVRLSEARGTKVLIIEGGGAFGIIPAFFLSCVENNSRRWLEEVDCLSGCSIGGILALAYSCGIVPSMVLEKFKARMTDCFDKRFMAKVNPLANPTYNNDGLKTILKELMGEKTLGDIHNVFPYLDVFVPTLNLTKNRYKVWDNISSSDKEMKAVDVAEATSAAPSYYEGKEIDGDCHIDGGMIEVAPLLTTATGLFGKRGIPFSDMDVLMIGCGEPTDQKQMSLKEYNGLTLLGIATDLLRPYVTLSNSLATKYWGQNMGFKSFTYFNPVPISGEMDDVKAMNTALERCPEYEALFLQAWETWMNR